MLRNKKYTTKKCEVSGCEYTRGASEVSERTYDCVLCVSCENEYQLGKLELPN